MVEETKVTLAKGQYEKLARMCWETPERNEVVTAIVELGDQYAYYRFRSEEERIKDQRRLDLEIRELRRKRLAADVWDAAAARVFVEERAERKERRRRFFCKTISLLKHFVSR